MSTDKSAAKPISERVLFHNNQQLKLVGDLYLPDSTASAGIVFGHCFTCSRHTRILVETCLVLKSMGIAALRFDFSGNGQSEGEFAETNFTTHVNEMNSAIQLMQSKGVQWIGLAGHSMGSAISLLTASENPDVKAVCTLAGRYSGLNAMQLLSSLSTKELEDTGRISFVSRGRTLELKEQFFTDAQSYSLPDIVSNLKIPLLAIHGDQDEIIPVKELALCKELKPAGTEIVTIKGADHMFSDNKHRQNISATIADWFKNQSLKK